jgi:GDP-4-dehydro-6-deoxy-D-mannose reductase
MWALQAAAGGRLHIVCVRPFGHCGPRQQPRFVAPDFARQIGRIRAGEQPPVVEVGNLDPIREFNDVDDIVAGHLAALEKGTPGRVYNLCSGRGISVRALLDALLARAGVKAEVAPRRERQRPTDVPALGGDPSRSREELGWEAATPLAATLDRLLDRWGAREQRPGN